MSMHPLSAADIRLLDRWQREFPLVSRPFAHMAADAGVDEAELMAQLARLLDKGVISRIGATLRPNTAGASLLAAMRVPPEQLERVAEIVNREAGINHNYEREHAINLWFVVTGADRRATGAALDRIRAATGLGIIELPLEASYFIDLGFTLDGSGTGRRPQSRNDADSVGPPDAAELAVLRAIEPGLPLVAQPFCCIGTALSMRESAVIARIDALQQRGVITRFGLIVRHRALGFGANAMAVWDVPDACVDAVGARLAAEPTVTLCYRRPRRLPEWPYNLFCMVHGRDRGLVAEKVAGLTRAGGLEGRAHAILFSRRCFRQRGPSLSAA